MKTPVRFLAAALACAALARAQEGGAGSATPAAAPAANAAPANGYTDEQLSEEFGWFIAKKMGISDMQFTAAESQAVVRGMASALAEKDSPYPLAQIGPEMDAFMQRKQAAYLAKLKLQNTEQSEALFSKLKQEKDVASTPSGLCYQVLAPGVGPAPKQGDTVRVNYTGRLVDGTVFDTTLEPRQPGAAVEPAEFQLGDGIIAGWNEGLQKIAKGGKIKLYVPAKLAYGDEGKGGIPPGAALIFDIELLDVIPAASH